MRQDEHAVGLHGEPLAIGIDIGGTNTTYGLVNRQGIILRKGWLKTKGQDDLNAYVAFLAQQIASMLDGFPQERLTGVGIGAPNANFYSGEIAYAANLPWPGVIPFAEMMSEALDLPTRITNDANAAALGEMTYGAAQAMKDFIMVTLGTGVGSGFVANGRLIYGHDGFAGELGHVTAVRDGRPCNCGKKGCLERYASATGIVLTAEQWLHERRQPSVLHEINRQITARDIHLAAAKGDWLALEIFEYTGTILGQTLADIVAITSPEAIIFFGGLARAGHLILQPTHRHMEANLIRVFQNKVKLLPSALPDTDAAILGASALAW